MIEGARFHPLAWSDLDEAVDWYERRQAGLGEELWESVRDAVERAVTDPTFFPVEFQQMQRVRVDRFPYSVYYQVLHSTVVVMAIHHHSREWGDLEQRTRDQRDTS